MFYLQLPTSIEYININLNTGNFSKTFKFSTVIPTYKNGDKSNVDNSKTFSIKM